jgi:hypothetical protein
MREVQGCAEAGATQAEFAIEMFCCRVKKYTGSCRDEELEIARQTIQTRHRARSGEGASTL